MALTKPFAQNGDKTAIPATTSNGSVSYDQGFGSFYALPPEEGGLFIDRAQFNQLMYDTTSAVLENKQLIDDLGDITYTKTEVNNLLNAKANTNATVNLTGNQSIAGVKTFSSPPVSATNPTANNQVANKAYVDSVGNTAVKLTGAQTIQGVKTFTSIPISATQPTNANQVANKAYVDSAASLNKSSPNYKGRISIPVGTVSYTAPSDGFLIVSATNLGSTEGSSGGFNFFSLSINSIVLAGYAGGNVATADRNFHFSAPLKKGDVVSGLVPLGHYGTGTITKTFIPYQ